MALDCHRVWRETVLAVMLTKARDVFAAHGLFTSLRRRGVRYVITDGVSWYRLATRWTRLRHSVVHGGMRSHVERFIETIKDRLKDFDCYFSSPKKLLDSALRLLYA